MFQNYQKRRIQILPYDRFLDYGPETLTDEELLAIILRTGSPGKDAITLACQVLELCGSDAGILGLNHLSVKDLKGITGIGEVKAVKLLAIAELSRRMALARFKKDVTLSSPRLVAEAYMERMRHLETEQCIVVFLNSADQRIRDRVLSTGTLNMSLVSSREILRQALLLNASGIILLHNHPSGNPDPSTEDRMVTKRLQQAAELLEVAFLDHIIIGDGTYFSFQERGDLQCRH
ncbi:MAG: DNA repair protein RadC [Lachnospiraceae bacterium]|nr:DNA repair protein RadC [Lachnospiraceae bacterium]